jgi:hypothetical protein
VALNKSPTPAGGKNTGVTINGSADFTAGCGVYSNSQNTVILPEFSWVQK